MKMFLIFYIMELTIGLVFLMIADLYFLLTEQIARTYGNIIIKARLDINNPIELDFGGSSTYYFFDRWYLPSELADRIKGISIDISNGYLLDDDLVEYLDDLGFSSLYGNLDGIIMRNIVDVGVGLFSTETSNNYVIFNKEQVKKLVL